MQKSVDEHIDTSKKEKEEIVFLAKRQIYVDLLRRN